jgi:hypothetical protein
MPRFPPLFDGQVYITYGCGGDMIRQAITQHLKRLEDANLVATNRRGRDKLHYLSPVPVHEIYVRWIVKYERQHLEGLRELKKRAEGDVQGEASICIRDVHCDLSREDGNAFLDAKVTTKY